MIVRVLALLAGLTLAGSAGYVAFSYVVAFAHTPRPPRLFRTALVELGAVVLLVSLWPLWLVVGASYEAAEEGEGEARGRRHPVVLLHGLMMNRTQWVWFARRLVARGVGPLYGTTYFSPQAVRHSAEHLSRVVERVRARAHAERVDIVAHSLGGVVARYYLEHLGGAAHVGRLVTIGSPLKGTRLGRFGLGLFPSARELMEDSALLAHVGPIQSGPGVEYTSVWSRADAVVIPPESSSVAPLGEDRVFDDLGHLSMLLSTRVVDAIAERLAS